MIFDLVVGAIIIFAMVQGYRNGFISTFLHMIGWILAIVLGFVWSKQVKEFLLEKTDIYDSIYKNIYQKFSENLTNTQTSFDGLPTIISSGLKEFSSNVAETMAESLSSILFTIMSFLLVMFCIKLVLWLFTLLLSKKNNDGISGFADGLLGMLFGMIKGVLFVYVLLAVLIPVVSLVSPEHTMTITKALSDSHLAKELYDNNLILLIVRDFL